MLRYYERGPRAALRLGARHGLFCVGCCWALMLVMFAVGVANLVAVALLTAHSCHLPRDATAIRRLPRLDESESAPIHAMR